MKYYLSTIADVDFQVIDGVGQITYINRTLQTANKYGLGLELAEFCISDNLEDEFDKVYPHFEINRNNCSSAILHGPFNELFPHAIDRKVARVAWERYDWTWKFCVKHGLDKIVLHGNYVPINYHPKWFVARQIEFWKAFLKEHPENITVCLENVLEDEPALITDIIEGVNEGRLKMCLDLGHANLTRTDPEKWIGDCADYVSHYHIHNNYGHGEKDVAGSGDRHLPPGEGMMDMRKLLDLAEELTPEATATIESCSLEESARWLVDNGYTRLKSE